MNPAAALLLSCGAALSSACAHLPLSPDEVADAVPESLRAEGSNWSTVATELIKVDGETFAYRELGEANGGTPVVFLVHLGAVLDNWDPRIMNGVAERHNIIAFDTRGVGASSGEPAQSIEQMAKDAILFIEAKGMKSVDLFGFSMGGMIAQEVALTRPDLVRRMVIAGTGPAGGEGIDDIVGVTWGDMVRGWLTFQDPKQFLFFTRSPTGVRAGKEFLARLQLRKVDRDTEISLAAFSAQLTAIENWGKKSPVDLSKITHPTLVANGDNDRMVPTKNTHDLKARIPISELIIYPDAGHGSIFQFHDDFVKRTIEFLAKP